MSFQEIETEARSLSERERARLVLSLMETLTEDYDVSDEEALRRDEEMESGAVKPMLHEEFVRRIERERRR